jgi:hypothetical protein
MDANNPVVKLCVQGMEAEGKGDPSAAAELFHRAWDASTNDFERCIAAHYVARHQPTANQALDWNQTAMDCARRVPDDSVAEFMPSLCLNLGKSLEDLGNTAEATRLYRCAKDTVDRLPAGGYRDIVQDGINRALQRVRDSDAAS